MQSGNKNFMQTIFEVSIQLAIQPRKPGSFTCARATAKTLVPSGHVNPQILGVIRIAASLPLREEW